MTQIKKSHSYESLLENLSATFDSRKKRFEKTQHLLSDEDKQFEKFLFALENDAFMKKEHINKDVVLFNFDDLTNDTKPGLQLTNDSSDLSEAREGSNGSSSERKHICGHANCNKSYTSSHGLKYHLLHGHNKENIYKPFVCNVPKCDKSFRNSNGLKYHMTHSHFGDKK
jgi:hypothetical protein